MKAKSGDLACVGEDGGSNVVKAKREKGDGGLNLTLR